MYRLIGAEKPEFYDMHQIDAAEVIESLGIPCLRDLSSFGGITETVIRKLLTEGTILHLSRGEYIARFGERADDFQVVLQGRIAYYKRFESHDALTRYFTRGEQIGFDEMIGLIARNGTDVAAEDSLLLTIDDDQFYRLHVDYPAEFGVFMINLARELSREIEMLEDVIGKGTGWERRAASRQPAPHPGRFRLPRSGSSESGGIC